jgi:hypothetical protein
MTEQIAVQFELVEPAGERRTWYGFFTESTIENTVKSLRACGWNDPNNDLSVFTEGSPLPAGFGLEVELVIEQEEYLGKVRDRIRWVNGGGGLALKRALTKEQATAFAARLGRQISALDKLQGRPSAGSSPRPAARPAVSGVPVIPLADVPEQVLEDQSGGAPDGDGLPF